MPLTLVWCAPEAGSGPYGVPRGVTRKNEHFVTEPFTLHLQQAHSKTTSTTADRGSEFRCLRVRDAVERGLASQTRGLRRAQK